MKSHYFFLKPSARKLIKVRINNPSSFKSASVNIFRTGSILEETTQPDSSMQ